MYPSDYGFASIDSSCRNNIFDCNDTNDSNWLFNDEELHWNLTSGSGQYIAYFSGAFTDAYICSDMYGVHPTLYLKSDVIISSGRGTESNPYILE